MHHFLIELLSEENHFESSDYSTGRSLKGAFTGSKGEINENVSSGITKGLMLRNQKAATVSLQKQCF